MRLSLDAEGPIGGPAAIVPLPLLEREQIARPAQTSGSRTKCARSFNA
jgi:hypothetical protein